MGTRSGSVDPTILTYLMNEGMTGEELERMLNKQSGFLGVYGKSSDSRVVCDAAAAGDPRAQLALNIQYHGIKKYIGAYAAVMNGLDACREIRVCGRKDADLPVFALTANAHEEDIRNSREAGMDTHISKPIDVTKLYSLLKEVYDRSI